MVHHITQEKSHEVCCLIPTSRKERSTDLCIHSQHKPSRKSQTHSATVSTPFQLKNTKHSASTSIPLQLSQPGNKKHSLLPTITHLQHQTSLKPSPSNLYHPKVYPSYRAENMFDLPPPSPNRFLKSFSSLKSGYDRNSQIPVCVFFFFRIFRNRVYLHLCSEPIRRQTMELKQAMPRGQVVSKLDPF